MDGGKSRRQQRPLHVGADVSFESSIYILPLEGINLLMDPHSICCLVIILQCFFLFLPLPGPFLPSSLLPHAPYPNLLAHLYPFIYLFYLIILFINIQGPPDDPAMQGDVNTSNSTTTSPSRITLQLSPTSS